ncbi:MAG TPA: hypothetical protein VNL14_20465 [Candidatus Acidoferrales bacterium]|nr:hypothetical protein [Candidatus Acidoferrales bacterium]
MKQETTSPTEEFENDKEACGRPGAPAVPPSPANAERPKPEPSIPSRLKASYKNVPGDWKAIPPARYRKAIGHLEAVLLEISADGTLSSNLFDWKPALPTLQAWAEHLRSALNELTRDNG